MRAALWVALWVLWVAIGSPAGAQQAPGGAPACAARGDVEQALREGRYALRASGTDVRQNAIAWHQTPGGEWVIVVQPRGQADVLCVVPAGGPGPHADAAPPAPGGAAPDGAK